MLRKMDTNKDQVGQEITIKPPKEGFPKTHIIKNQRHTGTMQPQAF